MHLLVGEDDQRFAAVSWPSTQMSAPPPESTINDAQFDGAQLGAGRQSSSPV